MPILLLLIKLSIISFRIKKLFKLTYEIDYIILRILFFKHNFNKISQLILFEYFWVVKFPRGFKENVKYFR